MKSHSVLDSFRFAWYGVRDTWKSERNMRVHCAAAFVALYFAWALQLGAMQVVAIALVTGMVIVAELANTALEALTDLVTKEHHAFAALAKNAAAGAVLITAGTALVVGIVVFGPVLWDIPGIFRVIEVRPAVMIGGVFGFAVIVLISLLVPLNKKHQ